MPVIAIVDDSLAIRHALSELLEMSGFCCCLFAGAAEFLDQYAPGRFDCVVSDVRMPGIGGIELQDRLRALGATVPIIFITSHADPAIRSRALEGGAKAFLTKPISDSLLLNTLFSVLDGDDTS